MRDIWRLVVQRLSLAPPIYSWDELQRWTPGAFEFLIELGLLSEAGEADMVACDACPEPHWEQVLRSTGGRRAFVRCPIEGTVTVAPERLRQWAVDANRVAVLSSAALRLTGDVDPLLAGRLWRLGRRHLAGRFRDFFLGICGPDQAGPLIGEASSQMASASGLLLLPFSVRAESGWEAWRIRTAHLAEVLALSSAGLNADLDFVEDLFPPEPRLGAVAGVRSVRVPVGTSWGELTIEVWGGGLRLIARGLNTHLSLEEAGLAEQDQKWETLRLLAALHGHLSPRSLPKQPDKTPFKTRIHRLREHLQALLPIDGDPIPFKKGADEYVCSFRAQLEGVNDLPVAEAGGWPKCRFVETRDGRLIIETSGKQRFRVLQSDRVSGKAHGEVAEEDGTVGHHYSFEQLGLKNRRGQFTSEGQVLVELLRGGGKINRQGSDAAVLKLAKWLRKQTGLAEEPLHFFEEKRLWVARFECGSER